jgi:hypothetical protein
MLIPVLVLAVGILFLGLASSWIIDTLLGKAVPAGIL